LGLNENMKRSAKLKIITDISSIARKATGKPLFEKMTLGEVFYYAPRSKEELKKFYETQVSAGVVPSFFETYCNGAVESLVCGTPTLLTDRAGASEVYQKYGLSDLIFSIDNMSSFEKALGYAESINFTIEEDLAKEIYENLCWKKVIKKYNEISEIVASKHKN
ncbi:MAG TPA: glycosyltransferase, partial [Candidatus Paceibacterota bacterium]|nr:glycosyltransferase [Candidatus Paceibacterota bacterium]